MKTKGFDSNGHGRLVSRFTSNSPGKRNKVVPIGHGRRTKTKDDDNDKKNRDPAGRSGDRRFSQYIIQPFSRVISTTLTDAVDGMSRALLLTLGNNNPLELRINSYRY